MLQIQAWRSGRADKSNLAKASAILNLNAQRIMLSCGWLVGWLVSQKRFFVHSVLTISGNKQKNAT
jgi:hypothetical protein